MILLAVFLIYEQIIQNNWSETPNVSRPIILGYTGGKKQSLPLWQGRQETHGQDTQNQGSTDNINGLPTSGQTPDKLGQDNINRGKDDNTRHWSIGQDRGVIQDELGNIPDNKGEEVRTVETIDRFLKEYGSSLVGRGGEIVSVGDSFDVSPFLLVAISVIESGACRDNFLSNNCMGFGNYNYNDPIFGFRAVAQALAGEGENGRYYKKCQKLDGGSIQQHECLLRIYNSENKDYAETVLRQRDYIKGKVVRTQ